MSEKETKNKIYCYVDETGQDTGGKLFIVAVVVAQQDREETRKLLEEIEQRTGKKATKWQKSRSSKKKAYIERVFTHTIFHKKIYFSLYQENKAYQELTVLSIASAINASKTVGDYKASIFIDGLQKSEVAKVGAMLRKIGIHTEKVRGVRDESNAIIRLADAVAGFVREYVEDVTYTKVLYKLGVKNNVIKEA
jgi:hypothetical protein